MRASGSLVGLFAVAVLVPGLGLVGARYSGGPRRMWGERLLDAELSRSIAWGGRRPQGRPR